MQRKYKPILFNTKMVQAILEGRKTTTRRIIKDIDNKYTYLGSDKQKTRVSFARKTTGLPLDVKIPYKKGDILYVRETWMIQSMKNYEKNIKILYKAEPQELKEVHVSEDRYNELIKFSYKNGWQPSLFMPKEAARLYLKVTNVKVERLQDMRFKDFVSEGIKIDDVKEALYKSGIDIEKTRGLDEEVEEFANLWDSTVNNKDKDRYGWNANPYVFVIEFERCDKPNE